MFLVGQKKNKELIDQGKLDNANFIIIKGPSDYGKSYIARYIANHYNMNYIELDYKVATVRELVESSNYDNNCVYHFRDFEKSSAAAKAALLKIAEETPQGVKIVVTSQASNILQTLTSRAYVLSTEPYTKEELEEYINTLRFDINIFNRLLEYHVDVTPSLLYKYKEQQGLEDILDLVQESYNKLEQGLDLQSISFISNKFWKDKDDADKIKIFLNILSAKCLDLKHDRLRVICFIQQALYYLTGTTITNYKMLIHNMMMEVV